MSRRSHAGDLARRTTYAENLAALREPVKDGQPQRDPVINDVLVHPQSEAGRGTRRQERRARARPPPDVDAQAHDRACKQRHHDFRVRAQAPPDERRRAEDQERRRHPRDRPGKQPLDEDVLQADEQGEACERHALERDDARAGDGEYRRGEVHLRHTLVVLSPEKRRMLALEHVAGHQAFHGLVGVEKAIAVEKKRRPADDDERRDEKKLQEPAGVSRPVG